ncbi:hypothetical protein BAUCODRAFT_148688 [Baudoinia panamericana UAMH 10762]|uniref:MOSC domain-containing protein n=1 Tax=Baudoinia panamericana (strain UAMH 10762) TaxID=717646 RepID=M2NAE0_BAUPA|nr:uncharacterized protein BAUCODRAFT_148688 [Baudoinia panamericana UAMH 10762]EMC95820.1 hypothetical protein BAUCODRAFT_148688 [Baudoinia panamericana UAMH 10762]
MKISGIYQYPVKGMRAIELEHAVLTKHGLPNDRRFMVLHVQDDGTFKNMAIAHYPLMSRFFPSLSMPNGDAMQGCLSILYDPPNGGETKTLDMPLKPKTDNLEVTDVTMHNSPCKAYKMGQKYDDWFSSCFGYRVVLVYLGDNLRNVLMSTSGNKQPSNGSWLNSLASKATEFVLGADMDQAGITFADCAPYLVCSAKSMEDVDRRLSEGVQMDIIKFRPNIIVSGADKPWDEDFWAELTVNGQTKIECIHNCGRCKSINIDYDTGEPGTGQTGEILKKLQSDRRVDRGVKYSPCFGRYSFLERGSEGQTIRVGDSVKVTRRNTEHTRFDWQGLSTS